MLLEVSEPCVEIFTAGKCDTNPIFSFSAHILLSVAVWMAHFQSFYSKKQIRFVLLSHGTKSDTYLLIFKVSAVKMLHLIQPLSDW